MYDDVIIYIHSVLYLKYETTLNTYTHTMIIHHFLLINEFKLLRTFIKYCIVVINFNYRFYFIFIKITNPLLLSFFYTMSWNFLVQKLRLKIVVKINNFTLLMKGKKIQETRIITTIIINCLNTRYLLKSSEILVVIVFPK